MNCLKVSMVTANMQIRKYRFKKMADKSYWVLLYFIIIDTTNSQFSHLFISGDEV
jgi:hypothetical protein